MSINIITRPEREFNGNSALLSKYSCSFLPAIYELLRQDVTIISINVGSTADEIEVTVADDSITAGIAVDTAIYIAARGYDTQGTVSANSVGVFSTRILTVDLPFTITASGGYLNILSRRNYYLQVVLMGFNYGTNQYESFSTSKIFPDRTGLMEYNAADFLNKNTVLYNDVLSARNEFAPNLSGKYYLQYTEHWIGSAELTTSDSANEAFSAACTKQIGADVYGNTLAGYTPFAVDTAGNPKAKWLTDFNIPTLFIGYPFDIGLLLPEHLNTTTMTLEQEYQNSAGAAINTTNDNIDIAQCKGVNRIAPVGVLSGDAAFSTVAGTEFIDIWIEVGSIARRGYVAAEYRAVGYDELDPPVAPSVITPYRITAKQKIRIVDPCEGIYVRWYGDKGWNYWLFNQKHELTTVSKVINTLDRWVKDTQTSRSVTELINVTAAKQIKLNARVLNEDMEGFNTILRSVKVQLYAPELTTLWQELNLIPSQTRYTSDQQYVNVVLAFQKPSYNTITQ